ncbi:hypothetical protein PHYBLDRAFT_152855 [Phycomyces blakesleeanus NRRL 1555(-)]|uniref:Uncharacterized protein n=1 Tax=Phycomyces blakesleeanus (strain ATCC 8743b / DSM 1359 / FGSC 10004 / NBRC 33097 / NRRL 1555) TaxID=763407 RepID=A0A162ZDJ5_PHYB8|nr:hypothetical protein PHYBLDRAFT_152855 [Phycomyces blakesleeanus NRRL 1555(-)]OAD66051.1 hypothetical protein PHYBLDRAFT_152855 [Phycomyces blakesleeanus NRRL 1555(-)]|eukprot:XP_018284091.1 hypothetical protein PHYBLDRAFT_152855 [Phycomyces blakesleeanus NRRL 1555(-)]
MGNSPSYLDYAAAYASCTGSPFLRRNGQLVSVRSQNSGWYSTPIIHTPPPPPTICTHPAVHYSQPPSVVTTSYSVNPTIPYFSNQYVVSTPFQPSYFESGQKMFYGYR